MGKKLKIEKNGKKQKWNLSTKKEPTNSDFLSSTLIEIKGNFEFSLEGCIGVYEYTDSYLKLKLKKGSLILCGSNFDIILFENRQICIKGKISSVEFCI